MTPFARGRKLGLTLKQFVFVRVRVSTLFRRLWVIVMNAMAAFLSRICAVGNNFGAMNYPVFITKAVIFRETWELPTILAPKKAGLTDTSHCHDLFPELLLLPAPVLYPFSGFLSQPSY